MERCNKVGCNINEFVGESVKFMLYNESDFTLDPDEEEYQKNEPKASSITEPAKAIVTRIVD